MTAKIASQTESENNEAQVTPSALRSQSRYSSMPIEAAAAAPTIAEGTSADLTSPGRPADCPACFVAYTVEASARRDTYHRRHTACRPFQGTAYLAASGRLAGANEMQEIGMDEAAGSV